MGTSPLAAGWCPPWSVTLVERDHVPLLVRGRSEERNGKRGLILKAFKRNMEKSQIQWTKYGGHLGGGGGEARDVKEWLEAKQGEIKMPYLGTDTF